MLWRIENGELDFKPSELPKICVLLVGTNNVNNSPNEIVDAIFTILKAMRVRLPDSYILVMSLPPKGQLNNFYRENVYKINKLVEERMNASPSSLDIYVDCDKEHDLISKEDGSISSSLMYDYLHFTDAGYRKFCQPLHSEIKRLLDIID